MRHFPRRLLFTLAASTTSVPLLASCGPSGGGGPAEGTGDKALLILGATADMYGWDPANQPAYQNWAAEAVWDSLAKTNSLGELEPDVAESWEISEDNRTFTATLRSGLSFSDGSEVNALAVQASLEYMAEYSGSAADYAGITLESPDESTISITWPDPQPVMANKIQAVKVLPGSYLDAKDWTTPVGSGPYILDIAGTTTGSVYKFTKNEDHWNAAHYPYAALEIRVIESETAAVSALTTGQVHAALVALNSVAQAEGAGMEVHTYDSLVPRLILSDREGAVLPPLGDVRVRQAINMVFEKPSMAQNLYLGHATPTAQVFREGSDAYLEDLEDPYPYDIEKAQSLMSEAGYSDGFTIELPTMAGQNLETLLPYVTQQLAEINISVTEVPLSGANAIGDLLSGTYPVVLWQLGNFGDSALQIYIESTPEGWWNLQHQANEYVDSRWEQIAIASPEESAQLQKEINQYIVDEAWFAPFVSTGGNYAYDASKVQIPTQSDQEALHPKLRDFQ